MGSARFPVFMLTEAEAFAKVTELAGELESFDPAALHHVRALIPFVRCTCSVKCSYDAERFVQDDDAFRFAMKRHNERYAAWCERDEMWRAKNNFEEKYPQGTDTVKYEKDVSGTVSVSGSYGLYLGVASIPDISKDFYAPWERMCGNIRKDIIERGRIAYEDREIEGETDALAVEKNAYDRLMGEDITKAVKEAVRVDSRTDYKRVLRGLRTSEYIHENVEYTTFYYPIHIYKGEANGSGDLILVEGCLGEVWTSFRAKPKPPPTPRPEVQPTRRLDEAVGKPPMDTPLRERWSRRSSPIRRLRRFIEQLKLSKIKVFALGFAIIFA